MSPKQMRAAHPLISSAGHVLTDRAIWRVMRMLLAPVNICCAAIAGAHAEHGRMMAADPSFLGHEK